MQVSGLTNVTMISAGQSFSLALKSDGTVWAWGSDGSGQLGDSASASSSTTPVQVSGLTGITHIAAGNTHGLAVKNDGTAWAWGYNNEGQVGNNTTTNQFTPVQMTGVAGASKVAGGVLHSLVLKSDGTMMGTGLQQWRPPGRRRQRPHAPPHRRRDSFVLERHGDRRRRFPQRRAQDRRHVVDLGQQRSRSARLGQQFTELPDLAGTGWLADTTSCSSRRGARMSSRPRIPASCGHGAAAATAGWAKAQPPRPSTAPIDISDAAYLWKVGRPTFSDSPGGTPYTTDQTVTITSATPGADIHYTLDGDDPTDADTLYTGPVTVDVSLTLKARGYKSGYGTSHVGSKVYTLTVAARSLPRRGRWIEQSVHVAAERHDRDHDAGRDDSLHDQRHHSPTASSPIYTGPLNIATKTTLRAAGFRDGWTRQPRQLLARLLLQLRRAGHALAVESRGGRTPRR